MVYLIWLSFFFPCMSLSFDYASFRDTKSSFRDTWCNNDAKYSIKPYVNHFISFFLLFILFYFYFTILYWFCHTLTWILYRCVWVPHPEAPSHHPPHIISLGHPRAPAPSILYPVSNLDWQFISYMILYMFQCHSPKSSHPLPLPQNPKVCSIHLCLFCCLA